MSLYDDLDISYKDGGRDSKPDMSGWSSGYKLLQSQLQVKKANQIQSKRQRQGSVMAPVVNLKRTDDEPALHFNQLTGKLERLAQLATPVVTPTMPVFTPVEMITSLPGITNEYDPLHPNDYDDIIKKRREQKQKDREEDRRRDMDDSDNSRRRRGSERGDRDRDRDRDRNFRNQERNQDSEFDRARRRREQEEEEETWEPTAKRGGRGAAIAPPMSLIEDDAVAANAKSDNPGSPPPTFGIGYTGSVASKIMAKYGYKAGQGLGRSQQGMSTALQVEKTSKRGGKIIHEKDVKVMEVAVPPPPPLLNPSSNANLFKNPSKVILLRNMVGSGEVDDDLEQETGEECAKYGIVIKCVIFEIPDALDEEAVRIFVEFERMEAAIKAVVDMNGRFFGGRTVQAGFYNLDKFRRLDLAADPLE